MKTFNSHYIEDFKLRFICNNYLQIYATVLMRMDDNCTYIVRGYTYRLYGRDRLL